MSLDQGLISPPFPNWETAKHSVDGEIGPVTCAGGQFRLGATLCGDPTELEERELSLGPVLHSRHLKKASGAVMAAIAGTLKLTHPTFGLLM